MTRRPSPVFHVLLVPMLAGALLVPGCEDDDPPARPPADAGSPNGDAGPPNGDAGLPDGGPPDVRPPDDVPVDTGPPDAVSDGVVTAARFKVAPKVLMGSSDVPCSGGLGHQIATDAAGTIYVVVACKPDPSDTDPVDPAGPTGLPPKFADARSFLLVSHDGGQTFSQPAPVGRKASRVHVVAGSPGWAVVVSLGGSGFTISRTEDGGATWSPSQRLADQAEDIALTMVKQRLVIYAETNEDRLVWSSDDGGRTLRRSSAPFAFTDALGIDDAGTVWASAWNEYSSLHRSLDGGSTFQRVADLRATPPSLMGSSAFGRHSLFVEYEATLVRTALEDPDRRIVIPLKNTELSNRLLVPLPGGGVAVVERTDTGRTLWWPRDDGSGPLVRFDRELLPSDGVALSDDDVALLVSPDLTEVRFAVTSRPN